MTADDDVDAGHGVGEQDVGLVPGVLLLQPEVRERHHEVGLLP